MSASLHGEVRVTDDPAGEYALLALEAERRAVGRFWRLGVSGGSSGEACLRALVAAGLDWSKVEVFFADERCVPADDARSNAGSLAAVLGDRFGEVGLWRPMSCTDGPRPYERRLREVGSLDLLQLGFGPDGHTASLFPGSAALDAAPGALVAPNSDPTGRNPLERMTLTFEGIALASTVVVVVAGAEKRDAFGALLAGEELPAGRVRAGERLLWIVDSAAAEGLELGS